MSGPLKITVGPADRVGKRVVEVINGSGQHRDRVDVDDAQQRARWRGDVIDAFGLESEAAAGLEATVLARAAEADRQPTTGRPLVRSMDQFATESVEWLWPGYLPAGALSLWDGDPGLGKSQATCWLSAAVSTGGKLPDGTAPPLGRPRGVLLLSAEDDPSRTIKPRLEAVGADLSRIGLFGGVDTPDGDERPFVLPYDAPALEEAIRQQDAALVVVDPLVAYLAADVSMNNDADVRRALKPLSAIAERTGAAILMLRHLNKKAGASSMYRGGGSIGIVGAARAAFLIAKSDDDPELRILAPVKMNLAAMPPALTFTVEPHGDTSRVVWGGETSMTADELVGQRDREQRGGRQYDTAINIIRDTLAGGPRGSNEIEQAIEKAGVSTRTYWRARKALGVVSEKSDFGGQWLLSLPADEDPKPYDEFM